jgi:hypothetical protein
MTESQGAGVVLLHLLPEEVVSSHTGDGFEGPGGIWEGRERGGSPGDAGRDVGDAKRGGGGGGMVGHGGRVGLEVMVDGEGGEPEGEGGVCEEALDEEEETGGVWAARVCDDWGRVSGEEQGEKGRD